MKVKLPDKLLEQLEPGENIIDTLKTTTIASRPDYTVLTNRRIIYFNEKHLGRFEFIVIPYSKLQTMKAERGLLTFGKVLFRNENMEEISLNWVKKEQIEPFIESLEEAMNNVAVEPISIRRIKNLGSNMIWEFEKPPELIFRSQRNDFETHHVSNPNPLDELKMRYVKGEISEVEYNRMKRFLELDNN